MAQDGAVERARENASGIVATLHTGLWLAAMFLGFEWWFPLMLFGYVAVVPLVGMLFDEEEETDERQEHGETTESGHRDATADQDTALDTLRDRYARGELTEEQFERKVERLLETETIEDVEDRRRPTEGGRDRDRISETE